jgi:hypothetical protein
VDDVPVRVAPVFSLSSDELEADEIGDDNE